MKKAIKRMAFTIFGFLFAFLVIGMPDAAGQTSAWSEILGIALVYGVLGALFGFIVDAIRMTSH